MITGEIETYLTALGMHPTDARLTAVLDLPGPPTDTNEEREAGGNVVLHFAARSSGTEFMFSGEQLVAVFLGTQPREAWGVHPRPRRGERRSLRHRDARGGSRASRRAALGVGDRRPAPHRRARPTLSRAQRARSAVSVR